MAASGEWRERGGPGGACEGIGLEAAVGEEMGVVGAGEGEPQEATEPGEEAGVAGRRWQRQERRRGLGLVAAGEGSGGGSERGERERSGPYPFPCCYSNTRIKGDVAIAARWAH